MKHDQLKTGKGELNSTSGNHLCGLLLGNLPQTALPPNFQPRRVVENSLEAYTGFCLPLTSAPDL